MWDGVIFHSMALTVLDGAAESSASSLFSWRTRLVGRGRLPTEIAATMDIADQVVLGCLLVAWSKMKKNNAHQLGKEIWHKRLQVGLWNSTGNCECRTNKGKRNADRQNK